MSKILSNLQVLEIYRNELKEHLGEKYIALIQPFIDIIEKTMEANQVNHFEAARILNTSGIFPKIPKAEVFIASALMEMVEEINLKELKTDRDGESI